MPVFECSRCNELTYSSSKTNAAPCPDCGSERKRLVYDAASFAEAKVVPRATNFGDHAIAVFDDFEQVAAIATQFVDQANLAGGLVMAAVPQGLEDLMLERMHPDDVVGIFWEPPSDTYGPTFAPRQAIDRFIDIAESEDRPIFVLGCADEPIQGFTSKEGWVEYERMAHEVAVQYGLTVMCLYDTRLHDAEMLRAGLSTHGLRADPDDGELRRNEAFDYEPPAA
ncbi:MAG TPA: MEDS domain-containing protein [Solirubrobacteraceae bacterium]|jgi:DNA-directed RNA polymerase subunit RPC12/RpoP